MKGDRIPCKHIFSNGTEFELFLEWQCWKGCARYRNDHCRILNAIYKAMFDEKYFPYDALEDVEGYGGKYCKYYTKHLDRKKHKALGKNGQMYIDEIFLLEQ